MDVATEGDEAAQQGGASAEDDGAVQMGTEGVGLEDSTDGAVGLGWGAAEAAAASSTDTAAGSAEGVEMEVADSTDTTTATTRRRKRPKRPGKKQGGKLKNRGGFRSRQQDRDDGSGGGAGGHTAPSP